MMVVSSLHQLLPFHYVLCQVVYGQVRFSLVTLCWVHFSYVSFLLSFLYVLLHQVVYGQVRFSLVTLCWVRFSYVSFLLSFLYVLLHQVVYGQVRFHFVQLYYIRFCFITFRYVHGTYRHVRVFPLSPHTPHLPSIIVFHLHISPSPLLSLQSCPCPQHHCL